MVFVLRNYGAGASERDELKKDLVGEFRSEFFNAVHWKHFLISCVFHKQTNKAENNNEQWMKAFLEGETANKQTEL